MDIKVIRNRLLSRGEDDLAAAVEEATAKAPLSSWASISNGYESRHTKLQTVKAKKIAAKYGLKLASKRYGLCFSHPKTGKINKKIIDTLHNDMQKAFPRSDFRRYDTQTGSHYNFNPAWK